MATKQEVADYINANYESVWTTEEEAKIDAMLNPELATILIKLVLLSKIITPRCKQDGKHLF